MEEVKAAGEIIAIKDKRQNPQDILFCFGLCMFCFFFLAVLLFVVL